MGKSPNGTILNRDISKMCIAILQKMTFTVVLCLTLSLRQFSHSVGCRGDGVIIWGYVGSGVCQHCFFLIRMLA